MCFLTTKYLFLDKVSLKAREGLELVVFLLQTDGLQRYANIPSLCQSFCLFFETGSYKVFLGDLELKDMHLLLSSEW